MNITPLIEGFARQWTSCKTCGNVAYYDYTPGGLGRGIPARWGMRWTWHQSCLVAGC